MVAGFIVGTLILAQVQPPAAWLAVLFLLVFAGATLDAKRKRKAAARAWENAQRHALTMALDARRKTLKIYLRQLEQTH